MWQRIETFSRRESVSGALPPRVILAVGKQLRVSEELLDDSDAGELYVYKKTMSARALLKRLEHSERA